MEFRASAGEIERIDLALAQLKHRELQLLSELAYQREEMNALLVVRKLAISTLAPIHRLPNEVLGEIFLCGTEGPWDDEDCDAFVTTVSLVSKRWYQVALGTPAIWKRINIASVDLTTLMLRLERSKNLSIDIYAEWGLDASPQYIDEAMTLLCSRMDRWGSLTFRFVGITPFRDFLDVARRCKGVAPRLHSLSIMMDRYEQVLEHTAVPLNMTMPNIHHLQLDGVQLDWKCVSAATEVVMTQIYPSLQWSDLSNIRKLHLTDERYFIVDEAVRPCLLMLEELVVMKRTLGSVLRIEMPSLKTLRVLKGTGTLEPWEYMLCEYHHVPNLTTLVFGSNIQPLTPFVLHILKKMPALLSIRFDGCVPADDLFYTWATTSVSADPGDWICPHLRNLSIHGAHRDPSDAVDVFLKSRSGPRGGLPAPLSGWTLEMDSDFLFGDDSSDEDFSSSESSDS